jgi:tetratricopeptide (TPR) repeat protein
LIQDEKNYVMKSSLTTFRYLLWMNSILFIFFAGNVLSQNRNKPSDFRKEVVALMFDYKLEDVLAYSDKSNADAVEIAAAKSTAYSLMGNRDENQNYIDKGMKLLEPYKSSTDDYNIQVALAISYAVRANLSGLKKKAELSQVSIKHAKRAVKLYPELAHANFILGRYYYELSGMSSATAKVAKNFIDSDDLKNASYKLALSYLEQASKLAPDRFLYLYYTGAAHEKVGNKEKALSFYREADSKKRYTSDDKQASKELAKHLK